MNSPLEKEIGTLESAGEKLLGSARKSGADTAEVFGSYGRSTRMTMEKQDFHLASSSDGYQLGLRVLIGDQQGFASSNSLSTNDLKETASKAIETSLPGL